MTVIIKYAEGTITDSALQALREAVEKDGSRVAFLPYSANFNTIPPEVLYPPSN